MAGKSKTPPEWVFAMRMSEDWGIPPWEVEEKITAQWFHRWLVWTDENVRKANKTRKQLEDRLKSSGE